MREDLAKSGSRKKYVMWHPTQGLGPGGKSTRQHEVRYRTGERVPLAPHPGGVGGEAEAAKEEGPGAEDKGARRGGGRLPPPPIAAGTRQRRKS